MQKLILIPLLFLCAFATAQPAGYVPGTQVCWTIGNPISGYRDYGYFKAAGNGERHVLISFTGAGEKNCSDYQRQSPQKWLNDAGLNWDGRTVRAPGDTIVWEVFTLPNNADFYMGAYAMAIDTFFKYMTPLDTSDRSRFHIQGLSYGVRKLWAYMANAQNHNGRYRHVFSTTISMSGEYIDSVDVTPVSGNKRHWVWVGSAEPGPTPVGASQQLYDDITGHKRLTIQAGTAHNAATWDSCLSLKGSDSLTNRWLWMVGPPKIQDTCNIVIGGPPGYVRGTQVNWTFNGRQHGYFRAAGCGERHILVAFTGNSSLDSTTYQANSPQKLLQDAGINWNGRTVRAPGDTVVWEVLTIPYTSGHWMQAYANDINYFMQNIEHLDTIQRNRFHIAGVGFGVGRMWGYLGNEQTHNSPYRHIFSTTIGVSTTWSNDYPMISAASQGRRHWVWHGADETNPTPPFASTDHYNALNGDKRITIQTGGGHNATTWDSCFSLLGSDSSNNRWLWMVTPPGSLLLRTMAAAPDKTQIEATGLLLSPNPVAANARLTWPGKPGTAYRVTVTDITGRLRKSEAGILGSSHTLDVSTLEKGLYVVRLEGGGKQWVVKLMKE